MILNGRAFSLSPRSRRPGPNPLPLIRQSACDPIYRYSKGIPRLINLLCDTALVYGYAGREETITAELVHEAVRDKLKGRRIWRRRKRAPQDQAPNLELVRATLEKQSSED